MIGFISEGNKTLNIPKLDDNDLETLKKYIKAKLQRKNLKINDNILFWYEQIKEYGPLSPLLKLEFEEILVNGINKEITLIKDGKIIKTGLKFTDKEYFLHIANKMINKLGKTIDYNHPRVQASAGKGTRVSIAIPPYGKDYYLSIRKHLKKVLSKEELKKQGFEKVVKVFEENKNKNLNVAIIGPTGSGKTTLLNALINLFEKDERLIIVEDSEEINYEHENAIHLISRENLNINLEDAIIDALRLRPDRLVIGEIRTNEEVSALRNAILSSPGLGVLFTYHSRSINGFFKRLVAQGFRKEDLEEIDLIILLDRNKEKRFLKEVYFHGEKI